MDSAMPLAMAALDVVGQIRERSPTDLAIFGEAAGRLADRFLTPETGQALLARAVGDGTAEATAWLATAAGQRRFRIGLWRQRGGERIRILAAFASVEAAPEARGGALAAPARDAVLRLGRDMRAPLDAVKGFAGLLRTDPAALTPDDIAAHASDILSAAWRLTRIADDLLAAGGSGGALPPLRVAEVDIARLARRIARLTAPAARAAGVAIRGSGLPEPGRGPLVLGDESTLWSAVDALLQNAVRHGGRGATVAIGLAGGDRGLVLEIADDGPGIAADLLAGLLGPSAAWHAADGRGLAICQAMVRANGAELEIETSPAHGLTACIVFPAARCLNPV
jgi:signal transduction histidine kinase